MNPPPPIPAHTALTAALGLALVVLAVVSGLLWRKVRALSRRAGRADPVTVPLGPLPALPQPPPAPPAAVAAVPAPRVAVAIRPRSQVTIDPPAPPVGPTLIAVPSLRSVPALARAEAAGDAAGPFGRRFGDVEALAGAGATVAEISDRTGYPTGQVELILGLLRHRAAAGAGAGGAGPDA